MTEATNPQAPQDLSELSFKEASQELNRIVKMLESNECELETSLQAYERGVALLSELKDRLTHAEQKVTELLGKVEPIEEVFDAQQDTNG